MRPAALGAAVVSAALLGALAALGIGRATGWVGDGGAETVLIPAGAPASAAALRLDEDATAEPLAGNAFDPAAIYRARAGGVVTILSLFGEHERTGAGGAAQGSGFVVSKDGYILTNSHVITTAGEEPADVDPEAARTVYVEFRNADRVPARIVGWDVYNDVGLLKVDPRDHAVSPVPLGDSAAVAVGEPVAAIGSPFGQMSSLAVGVVSATERSIDSLTSTYDLVDAIQTDAPINRGNSGGPLFNARGEVIGINAQIRSESGNAEGVGFAIPINSARRTMAQLVATGKVRYAWVGVSTQTLGPRLARHFGYAAERGAAIQDVVPGSPAAKAGLRAGGEEKQFEGVSFRPGGDVIVAIDGVPLTDAEDVVRAITGNSLPGQTVTFTVLREGRRLDVPVRLGERPRIPPGNDR